MSANPGESTPPILAGNSFAPLILVVLMSACLVTIFADGLLWMLNKWESEEYSHGYLIPLIALFLWWQRSGELKKNYLSGSWLGPMFVAGALGAFVLGELSSTYQIIQYGFLFSLFGIIIAMVGLKGLRLVWVPFVYLLFMVPLPTFIYQGLSSALQLISSEIGVSVIRLFGISVFLEGNVIDLGIYQLQVSEACNGLRYLFPLTSFGFLCAVIFQAPWWQRAIVFVSSIPITILMNSFRIGVIGVLVNSFGIDQAEGFLHDFEGWIVFMVCVGILFAEMWVFAAIGGKKLVDVFGVDVPPIETLKCLLPTKLQPQLIASAAVLGLGVALAFGIQSREVQIPERDPFSAFPLAFDQWEGQFDYIEDRGVLKSLAADDYLLANYRNTDDGSLVGLWIAYYEEQRKARAVHSPRACLPGGGWRIESYGEDTLTDVAQSGKSSTINRAVIAMGDMRQLVYFWFVERGRIQTNEYAVKWRIFWDALTINRTDGALVRVTTFVPDVTRIAEAEVRLKEFIRSINPKLILHLPQRDATFKPLHENEKETASL